MKKYLPAFGLLCLCASVCAASSVTYPEAAIARAGLNNARVVFETTRQGTVAFLGGSITEMAGYRPLLMKSLKRRFPVTQFTFIAAGVSSTCADTGALRMREEIFEKGIPDLLFVEFAVNEDQDGQKTKAQSIRALEGIVRHARRLNPRMDIVFSLLVNPYELELVQKGIVPEPYKAHLEVAEHYGLGTANIGAELASRIARGTFTWKLYRDCHPSPAGNRLVADVQERLFDAAGFGQPFAGGKLGVHALPPPLDPFCYDRGRFLDFADIRQDGKWEISIPDVKALKVAARPQVKAVNFHSQTPGATCTFAFEGTAAALYLTTGPDAGQLDVSVDGGAPRRLELFDSRYSRKLHYPKTVMLADDLPNTHHTITLTLADTHHAQSRGTACRIYRFAVNGKKAEPVPAHRP